MGKIGNVKDSKKKGVNYIENRTSTSYHTKEIDFGEMLSPEDVKNRLFLGRSKVYELLRSGKLQSIRIGKQYRVSESALQSYIAEHVWADDDTR